jgi:hypothetical protein
MRRWFLSYHSPDQALAERLKAALERKDADARVFFAPSSLRAGGFWSRALAEEIAQADAFILLVGEKGVGDWQVLEYDEALDRRVKSPNFAVVLVLLKGQTAPGLPFLRRLHWIVTEDPTTESDLARLIGAAAGSGTRLDELWRYTSPYRGLAAMEEKDSDYFFGRGRETIDVLSVMAAAADRLPLLLGNSGVGKSSLAQAGVLAALKRQAWPKGPVTPDVWPQVFQESHVAPAPARPLWHCKANEYIRKRLDGGVPAIVATVRVGNLHYLVCVSSGSLLEWQRFRHRTFRLAACASAHCARSTAQRV